MGFHHGERVTLFFPWHEIVHIERKTLIKIEGSLGMEKTSFFFGGNLSFFFLVELSMKPAIGQRWERSGWRF